jgi:hypothetical protein
MMDSEICGSFATVTTPVTIKIQDRQTLSFSDVQIVIQFLDDLLLGLGLVNAGKVMLI